MKLICLLLLIGAACACGQTTNYIVSPSPLGQLTGYEGPFLATLDEAPSIRYQQVYGRADFLGRVNGAHLITGLTFSAPSLDITLSTVEIHLSTTQKQPDGLSSAFSQNVGLDETEVFAGSLHLFSTGLG